MMSEETAPQSPLVGTLVGNPGEPIRFNDFKMIGFAAETVKNGSSCRVFTRLMLTSDEPHFHRLANSLAEQLNAHTNEAGGSIDLAGARVALLVIRPDDSGELWLDSAAVVYHVVMKETPTLGAAIFKNDIADLIGISFPKVQIGEADRVVCLLRVGWRFAMFFDFNHQKSLSLHAMERDLGTLQRRLLYGEVYNAIDNDAAFDRLLKAGWFPFCEIIGAEFDQLWLHCQSNFDFHDVESLIIKNFDAQRVERMFTRWMTKRHFYRKERILRSALDGYLRDDPVIVLKIVLTEIEGILNEAHRMATGVWAKQKALLEFAIRSAEEKHGVPDTLMLPAAFGRYLKDYTFAHFDPSHGPGNAGSRHAVGHGAAEGDSYTQTRALQALLTLDQLSFFT